MGDVPKVLHAEPGDKNDGMDSVDWNDDKQATAVYRKEKAAKRESDQGSHQDENRRGRRGMTSARLNGDDGLGEEDSR
jgi:hypothetical protein